jgi:hypothetical protein
LPVINKALYQAELGMAMAGVISKAFPDDFLWLLAKLFWRWISSPF